MREETTPSTQDISKLRAQIDDIDAQIANLLVMRTEISQAVAFSKIQDAKNTNTELSFGWRPKREVEILRLVRQAEPSLGKRLLYMVWRAMITRNLANQAPMDVLCVKETDAASRMGFGAAANPKILPDCDEVIKTGAGKENLILSLPWPDENQDWWLKLLEPQNQSLKIVMALPHIDERTPEALCMAKVAPLETQNDYSLIVTNNDKPLQNGKKLSEKNGKILWLVNDFCENLHNIESEVYFLGAYAIA